jgi:hypothetical protein
VKKKVWLFVARFRKMGGADEPFTWTGSLRIVAPSGLHAREYGDLLAVEAAASDDGTQFLGSSVMIPSDCWQFASAPFLDYRPAAMRCLSDRLNVPWCRGA